MGDDWREETSQCDLSTTARAANAATLHQQATHTPITWCATCSRFSIQANETKYTTAISDKTSSSPAMFLQKIRGLPPAISVTLQPFAGLLDGPRLIYLLPLHDWKGAWRKFFLNVMHLSVVKITTGPWEGIPAIYVNYVSERQTASVLFGLGSPTLWAAVQFNTICIMLHFLLRYVSKETVWVWQRGSGRHRVVGGRLLEHRARQLQTGPRLLGGPDDALPHRAGPHSDRWGSDRAFREEQNI